MHMQISILSSKHFDITITLIYRGLVAVTYCQQIYNFNRGLHLILKTYSVIKQH